MLALSDNTIAAITLFYWFAVLLPFAVVSRFRQLSTGRVGGALSVVLAIGVALGVWGWFR